MSALHTLLLYALVGLPVGLLSGLALGLVARHQGGWGGYASFRRRAARLGHVCLVMLPLLAGFYALALEGRVSEGRVAEGWVLSWAVGLWIPGSIALACVLFAAAWKPAARLALPVPALAVTAGAVLFACAYVVR